MGMAVIGSFVSTAGWPEDTTGTSSTVYNSNSAYQCCVSSNVSNAMACVAEEDEEAEKQRHAAEMRKRNLGYLWRGMPNAKCLRFQVHAPRIRFVPCWSARRWRSRT